MVELPHDSEPVSYEDFIYYLNTGNRHGKIKSGQTTS